MDVAAGGVVHGAGLDPACLLSGTAVTRSSLSLGRVTGLRCLGGPPYGNGRHLEVQEDYWQTSSNMFPCCFSA